MVDCNESPPCEPSAVSLRTFETTFRFRDAKPRLPPDQPGDRRTAARHAATSPGCIGRSDARIGRVSADSGLARLASGLRRLGSATLRRDSRSGRADLPVNGSREALFAFAQTVVDAKTQRDRDLPESVLSNLRRRRFAGGRKAVLRAQRSVSKLQHQLGRHSRSRVGRARNWCMSARRAIPPAP